VERSLERKAVARNSLIWKRTKGSLELEGACRRKLKNEAQEFRTRSRVKSSKGFEVHPPRSEEGPLGFDVSLDPFLEMS
jgi:hypothetical protein